MKDELFDIAENIKRISHRVRNSGDLFLAKKGLNISRKIRRLRSIPDAKEFEQEYLWTLKEKYFPGLPKDRIIPTIVSMAGYDDSSGTDSSVSADDSNTTSDNHTIEDNSEGYVTITENLSNDQTVDTNHGSSLEASNSDFDLDSAIKELNENANPLNDYQGHCAANIREALEAGGIDTTGHPVDAKDYGDFLENRGFKSADESSINNPQRGDIVVIQPSDDGRHSHGHIAMYDGEKWISDAEQKNYSAGLTGDYTVYRHSK